MSFKTYCFFVTRVISALAQKNVSQEIGILVYEDD